MRLAIVVFAPRRCRPYITARATPPAPSTSTFLSCNGLGVPGGTTPPNAFTTDDETTLALSAELEAEVFIANNFSVSASHGIVYTKVSPAGGGDSDSSWNTEGADFSHIGFHYYFFGF